MNEVQSARCLNPSTVWQVPEMFRTIYSHAFEVPAGKRLLFISGQLGVTPDGSLVSDFAGQCEQAMDNIEALLDGAGMTKAALVKITYFLIHADDAPTLSEIRRRRWGTTEPPAVTAIVVSALARPEYAIEIEAVAAAS
jgi:2-iminobutanoate/2-iminopropanoate deaminase